MSHLRASTAVYSILSQYKDLTDLVGNRLFPIIADEGTDFPFVVYRRLGLSETPKYFNKDLASTGGEAVVELMVVSNDYDESIEVAEQVVNALQGKRGKLKDGTVISQIKLEDSDEDWIDNSFVQRLTFKISL